VAAGAVDFLQAAVRAAVKARRRRRVDLTIWGIIARGWVICCPK
jgi:hypothetical protein